jgi:hypothetical protein
MAVDRRGTKGRARNKHGKIAFQGESPSIVKSVMKIVGFAVLPQVLDDFKRRDGHRMSECPWTVGFTRSLAPLCMGAGWLERWPGPWPAFTAISGNFVVTIPQHQVRSRHTIESPCCIDPLLFESFMPESKPTKPLHQDVSTRNSPPSKHQRPPFPLGEKNEPALQT